MGDMTWLQAQVPRPDWEKLNKKRLELGYKWSEIILPAVETHMTTLKPKPIAPAPEKPAAKPATKEKAAPKAAAKVKAASKPGVKGKKNATPPAVQPKVTLIPAAKETEGDVIHLMEDEPTAESVVGSSGSVSGKKVG